MATEQTTSSHPEDATNNLLELGLPTDLTDTQIEDPEDLLEEVSRVSQLHEQMTSEISERVSQQQYIVRKYLSSLQQHNRSLSRIYAALLQPDLLEFQKQLHEGHISFEFVLKNLQSQKVMPYLASTPLDHTNSIVEADSTTHNARVPTTVT